MPSPIPPRDRNVYFVGAGLSSAFRLPNTAALLSEAIAFSKSSAGKWMQDEGFDPKLRKAFRFFYPDASHAGFQPDVVDFFSALRTYLDIGAGLVGTGFGDAPDLYRLLRRGIAHLLIDRTRRSRALPGFATHAYLNEMVQPGHIIITSNWDTVIEEFAAERAIPLRLTSRTRTFETSEVVLLKLHGSLDWCQLQARKAYADEDYAALKERQSPPFPYTPALPSAGEDLVRVRASSTNVWQRVRSRSREPYMVTMATGKADDLGPLHEVWRDAYRALSRAKVLEIVGYSMPADDVEVRTILRTGLQRGGPERPRVTVRNPSPDVHQRVRSLLDRNARSDYLPIDGVR
jgi:hypothetical protein